jgi:hypothetical protein
MDPVSILGGKSVYCINETQLQDARRMFDESSKVQRIFADHEQSLTRNEQAALAFVMIDRLLSSA